MELKIFLGKNKTGKTYEIYKLLKNNKNIFYISNNSFEYHLKEKKNFTQSLINFLDINNEKINNINNFDIYEILKLFSKHVLKNKKFKDKTIVFDQIENSSHPELVEKNANYIFELSKKINIIVITHSPIFLQKIFKRHINDIQTNNFSNDKNDVHKIVYKYFYKKNDKFLSLELSNIKIKKMFEKFQNREINNLTRILFSQNIFLIEGINDENIIYDYINNNHKYNDFFYSLIDCGSKSKIKKMYNILSDLKLTKILNICLFYDKDEDGKIEQLKDDNYFEIINEPNLEELLFIKRNKDDFWIKNKKHVDKQDLILNKEWILKNSIHKNVKFNLNNL